MGSSRVVQFTQVRPGGRWVHPRSLCLLGFALVVDGFIRSHWVDCSSRSGSLGTLGFALWLVGFIRDRWVHKVRTEVVRFNWDRWVHSRSPWVSLGLSRGVRFTLRGGRVHPVSFGSLGFALGVVGFIRSRWVQSGSPLWSWGPFAVVGFTVVRTGGRWVHPGWLGSSGVDGFT